MKFLLNFETHPGLKISKFKLRLFQINFSTEIIHNNSHKNHQKMGLHWNTEKQGLQLI